MTKRSWLEERRRDAYYRRAKREGYRSRAVYKLEEIDRRFRILRRGMKVVDLGAAPGGWLQYAAEAVGSKGLVLGVDIRDIEPLPHANVKTLKADVMEEGVEETILAELGSRADVVLSDLSPNISGVWDVDVARCVELGLRALEIAGRVLARGGKMVVKLFEGKDTWRLLKKLRGSFEKVILFKPKASRKGSSEIYAICLGFKGPLKGRDEL